MAPDMRNHLRPLPPPGLVVYPGYTAKKPETLIMKEKSVWATKSSYTVSFATPSGPGQPLIEISQKKNTVSFKAMNGKEVMRIVKKKHIWSGRGSEYHGIRGDGKEAWYLKLHRGWSTDYNLTLHALPQFANALQVQNKVLGHDKGILLNGNPVATISEEGAWKHMHRHDVIHVAAGMDMLLSIGLAWIRADKQEEDRKTANSGGGGGAAAASSC